ncbi:MAG: single-stranded-DNA-specific exonuclease RecJ [Candidatus Wallbacteria bacterium]
MRAIEKRLEFFSQDDSLIAKFSNELKISSILARLILNRGIKTVEAASKFLNCKITDVYDPFLMKDMQKACERIILALSRGEKVRIFGDYDVDGITSTALLYKVFKKINMDVSYFIPNRIEGGYGLNQTDILNAKNDGVSLIITVDCGISSFDEIEYANSLGIDSIVTDHHEVPPRLPAAFAILNPKQSDCPYPFKMLSGVGVAYKLAAALEKYYETTPNEYLDLVALGTVADIAPLVDENRILTKFGIEMFKTTKNLGIQALIEVLNLKNVEINTTHIGYIIAPRINAAGRIGDPNIAIKIFLTDELAVAIHYVNFLNGENQKRQSLENGILKDVEEQLRQAHPENVIMLASNKWHVGVIGIVASKIKEKYYKPTILISIEENNNCVGSARSVDAFSIVDALNSCSDILKRFGGHKLAAGFSIDFSKIDDFRKRVNQIASETIKNEDLIPTLKIDEVIKLKDITHSLINEIALLKPFGQQNPKPLFYVENVSVTEHRKIGGVASHLLLKVKHSGNVVEGIGFNMGNYDEKIISPAQSVNVVFELDDFTVWEGQKKIQMKLKDIRFNKFSNFEFNNENRAANQSAGSSFQNARMDNIANVNSGGGASKLFELKNAGNKYFMEKNYEKAYEYYNMALEIDRTQPTIYYNIGLVFKCQGNYEKAVEHFKKAIMFEQTRNSDAETDLIKKSQFMIEKIYNLDDSTLTYGKFKKR